MSNMSRCGRLCRRGCGVSVALAALGIVDSRVWYGNNGRSRRPFGPPTGDGADIAVSLSAARLRFGRDHFGLQYGSWRGASLIFSNDLARGISDGGPFSYSTCAVFYRDATAFSSGCRVNVGIRFGFAAGRLGTRHRNGRPSAFVLPGSTCQFCRCSRAACCVQTLPCIGLSFILLKGSRIGACAGWIGWNVRDSGTSR